MKELTKQIKEKSFHKVYLLTGDEPYLVLQAKHMLKNAMIKEGDTMNYAAFTDGKIDCRNLHLPIRFSVRSDFFFWTEQES
jgi:DNA polymerase-3 subunit delta